MFCSNCGAKLNQGAHFCESCGAKVGAASGEAQGTGVAEHHGTLGYDPNPPAPSQSEPHHFGPDDALAVAGVAAPLLGRGGAGGDIAGYMMSKEALENLEESGQGDSSMADMARTGLWVSKFRITMSIIGFIIFIIFALIMFSIVHSQSQNPGGLAPPGGHHLVAAPSGAGVRLASDGSEGGV